MDFSKLATKETYTHHVRHPGTDELLYDDGKPVEIVLYGPGSEQYRKAMNSAQNRHMKRNQKNITAEVLREENVKLLTSVTKEFRNFRFNGVYINSEEDISAMYNNPDFTWLKNQVDGALTETSNFLTV